MTFTFKHLTVAALVAALSIAPLTPAHAEGWRHHGGGFGHHDFGLLTGVALGVGAIVGAAATIVTAPVRVIADAGDEPPPAPVYAPQAYAQPVYASPAYYGYAPAYAYPHHRVVVYSYPQAYPAYGYGY